LEFMADATWATLLTSRSAFNALCLDASKKMHALCAETSEVHELEIFTEGNEPRAKSNVIARTNGFPSALAFDPEDTMFIGDFWLKSIVFQTAEAESLSEVASQYEGRGFRGPNSFAFSGDGTLYFTDSGPLGDTSFTAPTGSLFMIPPGQPGTAGTAHPVGIAVGCLAHPSGVAVSPDGSIVFVAETLANRILRFVRRPGGVMHCSVFHQFNGLIGPTCLSCDRTGRIYVGRFEFSGSRLPGVVTVLDASGRIVGEVDGPAAEITSILVVEDPDLGDLVYLAEQSASSLYRIPAKSILG